MCPRMIVMVFLLVGASYAFGQATTRSFSIGPETTIIEGPLNTDGTINYVEAINAILRKGITRENNAAIPFLQATTNAKNRETNARIVEALGVQLPADSVALPLLSDFVATQQGKPLTPEESGTLDSDLQKCMEHPWKATDFPKIAAWLKQEGALALLERACELPHCYVPWVSKTTPPNWRDALPSLAPFRTTAQLLAARAMLRAGNSDISGALDDLRRVQTLARFAAEQRTDLSALVAAAVDFIAMRGYDALASGGGLSPEQLKSLRRQIAESPALPAFADAAQIEEMLALDDAMTCIRGQGQRCICALAGDMTPDVQYDLGALPRTDWTVLLKTIHRECSAYLTLAALPFDQRLKHFEEATKTAIDNSVPASPLFGPTGQKTGKEAVEAFLKMRAGETGEQYAARMANWWVVGNPDLSRRMDMVMERSQLERKIAPLAVSLAEFHAAHGAYPESLAALGEPVLRDPFSGKETVYRREGAGYVLYSVGLNQKDDGGTGDDRPVRAERAEK